MAMMEAHSKFEILSFRLGKFAKAYVTLREFFLQAVWQFVERLRHKLHDTLRTMK